LISPTIDSLPHAGQRFSVLHILAGSEAGGLIRYVLDLSSAMIQQGHDVVVAGQRGDWHHFVQELGIPWLDVPVKGGPIGLLNATQSLQAHVLQRRRASGPVIVHAHHRKSTLVARRVQDRTGDPLLYTLHLPNIPMTFPWGWLTDWGDLTHVASEEARDWLVSVNVPESKIRLVHHGIHADRFPVATLDDRLAARQRFGLNPDQRVAAWVGRFDRPKNQDWMLDLALAATTALPDLHILMAGDGPGETRLRQRIKQQSLGSRVTLLGLRDPLQVYQACDALLISSAGEGFSFVTAEAMSVGRPVLRTRGGGCRALILEGITGRSVPIDKPAFIAAALEFLGDRTALIAMGQNAANHIRQNFTFDRQLQDTLKLYGELIAARP
jgi:glycosyltransferase involved in cell wall biosynthesis